MKELGDLLSIKQLNSPIIEDTSCFSQESTSIQLKTIECVIDEETFGWFINHFHASVAKIGSNTQADSFETLIAYVNSCSMMAEVINQFIEMHSIDNNTFKSFQCIKRIGLIFQETEQLFAKIRSSEVVKTEIELLNGLQHVFSLKYHDALALVIRDCNLKLCLQWVRSCILVPLPFQSRCHKLSAMDLTKLTNEMKKHHMAYKVMCLYLVYDSKNSDVFMNLITPDSDECSQLDPRISNLSDVAIFLDNAQLLAKSRRKSSHLTIFVLSNVREVAAQHYMNPKVVDMVATVVPDICELVEVQQDPKMIEDVALLVYCFGEQGNLRYPTSLCCKLLANIKYYNKSFPFDHSRKVTNKKRTVYSLISGFSSSNIFKIQVTAVRQAIFTFHRDWVQTQKIKTASKSQLNDLDNFQKELMGTLVFSKESNQDPFVMLQLYLFILNVNYTVNCEALYALLDACYHTNCEIECLQILSMKFPIVAEHLQDMMIEAISYWVNKDYNLAKFPWCLTNIAQSLEQFFRTFEKEIGIAALMKNQAMFSSIAEIVNVNEDDLLRSSTPKSVAYLTPYLALDYPQKQQARQFIQRMQKISNPCIELGIILSIQLLMQNIRDDGKFILFSARTTKIVVV